MKCEIILRLLCCLSDSFINKHCRAWRSMISLWIDFRTCKKYRILLSARQRSNNYLELSRENVLGNMMLSCWPCFIWKFFMIWFHKILKLISRKQPSCPRNIYILNIIENHLFSQLSSKFFERLSSALVKIFQIPLVILQTSSQFFFKFCITLQCHET